jgi:hypothetical protein
LRQPHDQALGGGDVGGHRDLVPEIWLPDPRVRRERELARFRLHLVKHRSMLKHRIHATLISFRSPVSGHGPVRRRRP